MKNLKYILLLLVLCNILSCKKSFLQLNPQGELTPEQLSTQDGVEGLLIGAYGLLNGNVNEHGAITALHLVSGYLVK